jgi:phosphoribosylformimino-5-aminoimidazole carboxamide ribotide isomerase
LHIIPVIDLMQGQAVHAQYGNRSQYQALQSKLCRGSAPLSIVAALLELYPFQTFYIADLDAIQGQGSHRALIETISQQFPQLHFWLDCGNSLNAAHAPNIKPVLGSESIKTLQDYQNHTENHVLSLDFNLQGALGIDALHESTEHWPDEVICMTLNQVGSQQGVDYKRLNVLKSLNKTSKIYAAGGVRDIKDVQLLKNLGIAGALVATALHDKKISSTDLHTLFTQ